MKCLSNPKFKAVKGASVAPRFARPVDIFRLDTIFEGAIYEYEEETDMSLTFEQVLAFLDREGIFLDTPVVLDGAPHHIYATVADYIRDNPIWADEFAAFDDSLDAYRESWSELKSEGLVTSMNIDDLEEASDCIPIYYLVRLYVEVFGTLPERSTDYDEDSFEDDCINAPVAEFLEVKDRAFEFFDMLARGISLTSSDPFAGFISLVHSGVSYHVFNYIRKRGHVSFGHLMEHFSSVDVYYLSSMYLLFDDYTYTGRIAILLKQINEAYFWGMGLPLRVSYTPLSGMVFGSVSFVPVASVFPVRQ